MFITFVFVVHIIVCVALILIVLLQTGKGADMGAAFGGASQTLFGSSGVTPFLSKLTTAAAIIFMITSITLAKLSTEKSTPSLLKDAATTEETNKTQEASQPAATTEQTNTQAAPGAQEAPKTNTQTQPATQGNTK